MGKRQDVKVGDVINVTGPIVPSDLRDKWFRVEAVTEEDIRLSCPYLDRELTQPYHVDQQAVRAALQRH